MDKNFIFIKVKSNKWRSLEDNPFLSQWLPGTATPAIHSALSLVTDLSCYDGPLHLLLKSADIWPPTCFLSMGSAVGWELPCDFLAILQKQQRLPLGIPLWLPNCPLSFGNSKHSPEGCIESVHPTWTRQLADSSQLSESYKWEESHSQTTSAKSPWNTSQPWGHTPSWLSYSDPFPLVVHLQSSTPFTVRSFWLCMVPPTRSQGCCS